MELKTRLTQEMRSAKTTQAILEATLDLIYEIGYQNTSTVEVVKRANISRGALLHHYPSKLKLMTAAIDFLLHNEIQKIRYLAQEMSNGDVSLEKFLDKLWGQFSGRLFMITIDFLSAARTDEELRESLKPISSEFHRNLNEIWEQFFIGSDLSKQQVTIALNMTLCLLRGMGVQSILREDHEYFTEMITGARKVLYSLLQVKS
jgi:AcrR family transcriptional regulator